MSRVPFWLVIVFACILCAASGLTLLHRAGLFDGEARVAGTALLPEANLALRAVERRAAGQIVIRGRAAPDAALTLAEGDKTIAQATADTRGGFTLPARLDLKEPLLLTLQAASGPADRKTSSAPLLLWLVDRKAGPIALYQAGGRLWPLLQPERPSDGSGVIVAEADATRLTLTGRAAPGSLVYVYNNGLLVARAVTGQSEAQAEPQLTPDPQLFTATVMFPAPPQADAHAKPGLRVDILDPASGLPLARSMIDLTDRAAWQTLRAPSPAKAGADTANSAVYLYRNFEGQARNPAEPLPGQVIPQSVPPPGSPAAPQATPAK